MRILLLFCWAVALLALSASELATVAPPKYPTPLAGASRALTPDEQLFTGLVEQMGAAISKGDMAALGRYMTPDYVHYNPGNSAGNRAEELAYVGSWSTPKVQLTSPVEVIRHGDMAVTVATSTFSGVVDSKAFNNNIQMMIAWVLRAGHWQMAVVQSKPLPV